MHTPGQHEGHDLARIGQAGAHQVDSVSSSLPSSLSARGLAATVTTIALLGH